MTFECLLLPWITWSVDSGFDWKIFSNSTEQFWSSEKYIHSFNITILNNIPMVVVVWMCCGPALRCASPFIFTVHKFAVCANKLNEYCLLACSVEQTKNNNTKFDDEHIGRCWPVNQFVCIICAMFQLVCSSLFRYRCLRLSICRYLSCVRLHFLSPPFLSFTRSNRLVTFGLPANRTIPRHRVCIFRSF